MILLRTTTFLFLFGWISSTLSSSKMVLLTMKIPFLVCNTDSRFVLIHFQVLFVLQSVLLMVFTFQFALLSLRFRPCCSQLSCTFITFQFNFFRLSSITPWIDHCHSTFQQIISEMKAALLKKPQKRTSSLPPLLKKPRNPNTQVMMRKKVKVSNLFMLMIVTKLFHYIFQLSKNQIADKYHGLISVWRMLYLFETFLFCPEIFSDFLKTS